MKKNDSAPQASNWPGDGRNSGTKYDTMTTSAERQQVRDERAQNEPQRSRTLPGVVQAHRGERHADGECERDDSRQEHRPHEVFGRTAAKQQLHHHGRRDDHQRFDRGKDRDRKIEVVI